MSTTTTNYNLVKPEGSEYPDISIINGNMDAIDAALTDATPSTITLSQSNIDRDGSNPSSMQTGDSYILVKDKDGEMIGRLVPLRGATGGVSMTLYSNNETSNGDEVENYISVFAMKDGSKAYAVGDPAAFCNAIGMSQVSGTFTKTVNKTLYGYSLQRVGSIVYFHLRFASLDIAPSTELGSVPSAFTPGGARYILGCTPSGKSFFVTIGTDGKVSIGSSSFTESSVSNPYIAGTYLL